MLTSSLCRAADFDTPWLRHWAAALGLSIPPELPDHQVQRKIWEWCAIAQALHERGMLQPGRRGCGFAVGQEPLPALFASLGAQVLATDQPAGAGTSQDWAADGQHATSLAALRIPALCPPETFDANVAFQPVDMRDLSPLAGQRFDFVWSACSLEHLGSLEAGIAFAEAAAALLKPGGVAVHTTEFNLSSNTATSAEGDSVLYRRQDLERLDRRLRPLCAGLARLDLDAGTEPADLAWDHVPFFQHDRPGLKLVLHGFVCTSALLIIQQGKRPTQPVFTAGDAPAPPDLRPELAALAGRLDDAASDAARAQAGLAPVAAQLGAVAAQTAHTRADLAALTARLAGLEAETRRSQAELAQTRAERDAAYASTSWRLTAPLRRLGAALRRGTA